MSYIMPVLFMLALLGGLLSGVLQIVKGVRQHSKRDLVTGILITSLAGGFIGFIIWAVVAMNRWLTPITDPGRYQWLMTRWGDSPVVAHFPRAIPAGATRVRLYYSPGPMQAPMVMQLRMGLPAPDITRLTARCAKSALESYPGDAAGQRYPTEVFLYAGPRGAQPQPFPHDFTIYQLYVDPNSQVGGDNIDVRGVAISKSRGEVVYWAGQ